MYTCVHPPSRSPTPFTPFTRFIPLPPSPALPGDGLDPAGRHRGQQAACRHPRRRGQDRGVQAGQSGNLQLGDPRPTAEGDGLRPRLGAERQQHQPRAARPPAARRRRRRRRDGRGGRGGRRDGRGGARGGHDGTRGRRAGREGSGPRRGWVRGGARAGKARNWH